MKIADLRYTASQPQNSVAAVELAVQKGFDGVLLSPSLTCCFQTGDAAATGSRWDLFCGPAGDEVRERLLTQPYDALVFANDMRIEEMETFLHIGGLLESHAPRECWLWQHPFYAETDFVSAVNALPVFKGVQLRVVSTHPLAGLSDRIKNAGLGWTGEPEILTHPTWGWLNFRHRRRAAAFDPLGRFCGTHIIPLP